MADKKNPNFQRSVPRPPSEDDVEGQDLQEEQEEEQEQPAAQESASTSNRARNIRLGILGAIVLFILYLIFGGKETTATAVDSTQTQMTTIVDTAAIVATPTEMLTPVSIAEVKPTIWSLHTYVVNNQIKASPDVRYIRKEPTGGFSFGYNDVWVPVESGTVTLNQAGEAIGVRVDGAQYYQSDEIAKLLNPALVDAIKTEAEKPKVKVLGIHTVRSGETVEEICSQYGMSRSRLHELQPHLNLKSGGWIYAGQKLKIEKLE